MMMPAALAIRLCKATCLLWVLWSAAACTAPPLMPAASSSPTQAPGQVQILVMLRETPRPHFRPGEGYAPGSDWAVEPAEQRRQISAVNHDFGLTKLDQWLMRDIGVRCYLEASASGQDVSALLSKLAADKRVESAQLLQQFHTLAHNDAYYGLQTNAKVLHLDALHRLSTGRHVRIALIDTGVESDHPDLQEQIVDVQNFVSQAATHVEGHGTKVAGLIAAKADNGLGMVGVAPDARLMSLRACWEPDSSSAEAVCSSFTLAKALQYAMGNHAQVVNLSLAGPPDKLLARLVMRASELGIIVVAAVDPNDALNSFPANLPDVVAVTCCSLGPVTLASGKTMISAPGLRVLTTTPHASWGFVSGSSFATAQISGLTALMLELAPSMPPSDVARLLEQHRLVVHDHDDLSVDTVALLGHLMSATASGPSVKASGL